MDLRAWAPLVKEVGHEGTLPGKTLTPGYFLSSYLLNSSTAFRYFNVELESPVTLIDGRFDPSRLALQVTDTLSAGVFIKKLFDYQR